jgi:fermentation-respiration switch protein FrsA (DUF1100 family)
VSARSLLLAAAVLAAGYTLLLALAYAFQSRLLYFPQREIVATPAAVGLAYEDVRLRTSDGVEIAGWWVPGDSLRAVLFFHGNAGNISGRLPTLRLFHELGFGTLIIDYRGYGNSGGRPTEQGTYRDAEAAWRWLTETQGFPPERIAVFGRSLGGAVAAWLADQHTPGALIVESSFTSVPALAAELYPWLPARLLSRFRYATESVLPRVDAPVLVVHGRGDEIIPFRHGERLYAAAREPKAFLEIPGGHNDWGNPAAEYREAIGAFLDLYLR